MKSTHTPYPLARSGSWAWRPPQHSLLPPPPPAFFPLAHAAPLPYAHEYSVLLRPRAAAGAAGRVPGRPLPPVLALPLQLPRPPVRALPLQRRHHRPHWKSHLAHLAHLVQVYRELPAARQQSVIRLFNNSLRNAMMID